MTKLASVIALILTSGVAAFAAPSKRKPSQSEAAPPIQITVVYGDRTTLLTLSKGTGNALLSLSGNSRAGGTREVTLAEADFIAKKIDAIPSPSNDRRFCSRSYVSIVKEGREIVGCLGAPNPVAKQALDVANALSLKF